VERTSHVDRHRVSRDGSSDYAGRRPAQSSTESPQVYVELIVKACPSDQPDKQAGRPDAVRGYYTEPINQAKSCENERSPTKAEREAGFTAMHCIDVPVPPEVIMGESLTREACMGHIGYLIAMQYLQQNPATRRAIRRGRVVMRRAFISSPRRGWDVANALIRQAHIRSLMPILISHQFNG
jgi:hypothetical protein